MKSEHMTTLPPAEKHVVHDNEAIGTVPPVLDLDPGSIKDCRRQAAAIQRSDSEVSDLGADGAFDVKVVERSDVWGSHAVEFLAYGTAMTFGAKPPEIVNPGITVLLNDLVSEPVDAPVGTFQR
jgi:hypothetical protein